MLLSANEREKKRTEIASEIMTSKEVVDMLEVSRARLNQYVKDGRITPIIQGIYLKSDIVTFKYEFNKARKNNKWLKEFE